MHYGGLEPAGYLTGENAIMTWITGIRHSHLDDSGYGIDQKLLKKEMSLEEQVRLQVEDAQWRMVLNSLVICLFGRGVYDGEIILQGLSALGLDWDMERLRQFGAERLRAKYRWKKACGFDPKAVTVPEKMFRVRTSTGIIDKGRMARRLKLFMQFAGIDEEPQNQP
jgi:aldehyde:ferredoxin oxidoreductase